jgi:hypothetical protein
MNIFVVLVALLTLCNLATFLLSLPSNLMAEKRDVRRESSATNKTTLLTVGDSSVEQKNAPYKYLFKIQIECKITIRASNRNFTTTSLEKPPIFERYIRHLSS